MLRCIRRIPSNLCKTWSSISMTKVVRIATFLAIGLIFTLPAFAQQPTANLNGTIVDPNGAVIPNATVTVMNRGTNFTRTVTSNSEGEYNIPNLPVGTYQVTFS